jgi:hypothetical protein
MRCANCDAEIQAGDVFCGRCGATRNVASTQPNAEFREVFCNGYVTGFSVRAFVWTAFNVIFGLIFSIVLLLFVGFFVLQTLYVIFGLDLYPALDIRSTIPNEHPSIWAIIGGILVFIVGILVLGTFALHNLYVVKRRLFDRLYLLAGRPLASVEGKPNFEPDSESGYTGVEVGELYFKFDDCWLVLEVADIEELDRASGSMRIWYIPAGMRSWTNSRTGKLIKYNCTLVRAEWRPLN